ncbi:hypothetical protein LOD99_5948 [Oopsacas minuta]|uniref:Cation-dependent mannose-6-phosphate receptor n=1 Tax=Oopsacas minuta TaxID=111878 RepID=A0AAV7JP40_9METZ|nr:hypothetical protein LOD99_5948 [Oopsacas minuta]
MFVFEFFLLYALFVCVYGGKEECKRLSSCKCQHSKGTVDLSNLEGLQFTAENGTKNFSYFPCKQSFDLPGCMKSDDNAICVTSGSGSYSMGTQKSVKFIVPNTEDYGTIMAQFQFTPQGEKPTKHSELYIKCQHGETATQFKFDGLQNNNVVLQLTTKQGCYIITAGIWGNWYILVGVIVLIIATFLILYSIATVCKYKQSVRGLKLINHTDHLRSVARLILDGFRTSLSCFPYMRQNIGVDGTSGYQTIYDAESNRNYD